MRAAAETEVCTVHLNERFKNLTKHTFVSLRGTKYDLVSIGHQLRVCLLQVVTTKPTGSPDSPLVIHIFDLDETLIQFNSLLTGAFARETMQLAETAKAIGEAFEDVIISVGRALTGGSTSGSFNQSNLLSVATPDSICA